MVTGTEVTERKRSEDGRIREQAGRFAAEGALATLLTEVSTATRGEAPAIALTAYASAVHSRAVSLFRGLLALQDGHTRGSALNQAFQTRPSNRKDLLNLLAKCSRLDITAWVAAITAQFAIGCGVVGSSPRKAHGQHNALTVATTTRTKSLVRMYTTWPLGS